MPTGAVAGFCNILNKLLNDVGPTGHMAVLFDAGRKTFRNEIYPEYKAHRPPPPEDLIPQFELIRQATRAFNVASIDRTGFEADDLIASYARAGRDAGYTVVIISSDKDLMQLIEPGISMMDPLKNHAIGEEQVVYLQDGMTVMIESYENEPLGVQLPDHVTLEVTEADAVVKGQTASSSYKPAVLENNIRTLVPPHIEAGARVVIATEDGSYVERAKD